MKKQWLFIAACTLVNACSSQSVGTDAQPALHAVQDQELRTLMDRMNALMMEKFLTEYEMDIERARFARQIVDASKVLESTARTLVDKVPSLGLEQTEQNAFRHLAQILEQQAHRLQKQAENGYYKSISATLHEMTSTCMACHTLFRKPAFSNGYDDKVSD